jgi:hypothetical protein
MLMQPNGATLQYAVGVCFRAVCLSAALMVMFGCAAHKPEQSKQPEQPKPQPPVEFTSSQAVPEPAAPLESRHKSEQAEIQEATPELPGSGQTAWAPGFVGDLIMGLDGQLYDAYNADTIKHVQMLMTNRGLYSGPVNGILDAPTMQSIYTFQVGTHSLLQCGVPTPRTRKFLEQGSHTDVAS